MKGLTFTHPHLWPWLLLAVPLWLGLWWLLRARVHGVRSYGAVLAEPR